MNRNKPHLPPLPEPYYPPKSSSVDSTAKFQDETVNGGEMTMHQNTRPNNDCRQHAHLLAAHAQTQSYPAYPDSKSQYAPAVDGGPQGIGSPTSDSSTWGDGYTDENRPSTTTVRPPPSSFDPKEHLPSNGLSSPDTKYLPPRDNVKQALPNDGKTLSPMKDSQRPLSRSPPDSQSTLMRGKPQSAPPAPANGDRHVSFKNPITVYHQAPRAGHRRDESNSSTESGPETMPETPHMATNISLPSDDASNESKTAQNNDGRTTSKPFSLQTTQSAPPVVTKLVSPTPAIPTPSHRTATEPAIASELDNMVGVYTSSSPDESKRFSQNPATDPPCCKMVVAIDGFGQVIVSGEGATITCEQLMREVLHHLHRKVTVEMKKHGTNYVACQLQYFQRAKGFWRLILRAPDK